MTTTVSAVQTTTTSSPVSTWTIDPAHSLVEFAVKHMMFSTVKGRFGDVSGMLTIDETDLSRSSVEVEIATASVDTREPQRDAHLRSPDFFDAERFLTLTFRSTRVEPVTEAHVRVGGDLTIRDVTREVVLDTHLNGRGTNPYGKNVVGFSAETSINRKDFGLSWNVALEAGGWLVGDTIKISLEVEAIQQD